MLDTELTIVVFVAAIIGAALLPGCTFNVYLTDQVIYGTVTQEPHAVNEKFSAVGNHPQPRKNQDGAR